MFNTQAPWNVGIVQDVTASRALGATYTNTTGKTMFVMITVSHRVMANLDGANIICNVNGLTAAVSGVQALDAGTKMSLYSVVVFAVPPGATYDTVQDLLGGGTNTLEYWTESY